jgi:fluoride exporter
VEPQQTSQAVEQEPAAPALRAPWARLSAPMLAAVFAGGVIGTLARAALAEGIPVGAGQWPWATFAVNLAAAALLGFTLARLRQRPPRSQYLPSFVGGGVCGALSTFSTMMLELQRMLQGGHLALALSYGAASVGGGFAAIVLATRVARGARWMR